MGGNRNIRVLTPVLELAFGIATPGPDCGRGAAVARAMARERTVTKDLVKCIVAVKWFEWERKKVQEEKSGMGAAQRASERSEGGKRWGMKVESLVCRRRGFSRNEKCFTEQSSMQELKHRSKAETPQPLLHSVS